jgi:hypothetical protein
MRESLASEAGVPGGELAAVVEDGVEPSSDLVRSLAPALEIHTADLFVIAGLPVPEDLASAFPTSPWDVGSLLRTALRMNADHRGRLEASVGSLLGRSPAGPTPTDNNPDTPGALLLRLLRNRNMRSRHARILRGRRRRPVRLGLHCRRAGLGQGLQHVTAFAHLLGYRPGDVVALTGIGPVVQDAKVHPAGAGLDSEQLREVMATDRTA